MLDVALTAVGACGGKSPADQAQDELNAGLAADAAGNVEEAATHYKACLAIETTNQFCIFNLGVQAQNAGRLLEAENTYRLALLQDPDFASALYNLAILRVAAGSLEEGIDLYKHLIEVDPNNASGPLQSRHRIGGDRRHGERAERDHQRDPAGSDVGRSGFAPGAVRDGGTRRDARADTGGDPDAHQDTETVLSRPGHATTSNNRTLPALQARFRDAAVPFGPTVEGTVRRRPFDPSLRCTVRPHDAQHRTPLSPRLFLRRVHA